MPKAVVYDFFSKRRTDSIKPQVEYVGGSVSVYFDVKLPGSSQEDVVNLLRKGIGNFNLPNEKTLGIQTASADKGTLRIGLSFPAGSGADREANIASLCQIIAKRVEDVFNEGT